jgi:hypothetical protein
MSDKRKKEKFAAKRVERLKKQEAEENEWRAAKGLHCRRVAADPKQQVPINSYSQSPPTYYEDIEFTCRDCKKIEVWTAHQQKWYYEVVKGSLFATAVRCHDCRKKVREQKAIQRQQMAEAEKRRSKA